MEKEVHADEKIKPTIKNQQARIDRVEDKVEEIIYHIKRTKRE